jgi:hypothetical protein
MSRKNSLSSPVYWAKDSGRNMTFVYTDEARDTLANGETADQVTAAPRSQAAAAGEAERAPD